MTKWRKLVGKFWFCSAAFKVNVKGMGESSMENKKVSKCATSCLGCKSKCGCLKGQLLALCVSLHGLQCFMLLRRTEAGGSALLETPCHC